jgi:inhibitor of cysteine peptidase
VYTAEVSGGGQGIGRSCDEFEANNHLSDDVTLAVGDTFELSLCANATTGFQWDEVQLSDAAVLNLVSREYLAPKSDAVGAAGSEHFVFKARQAGSTTVKIEYSRPWEGGEKGVWSYTLTATVR